MLAFLASLLVVACIGALGGALLPAGLGARCSRWEVAALAWTIGAATVCLLGTAILGTGLHFPVVTGTVLAAGLLGSLVLLRRRRAAPLPPAPDRATGFSRRAKLLLAALGIGSILGSLVLPINEFDPMLHFAFKGKILTEIGTPFDEALDGLVDASGTPRRFGRIVTHPNYPLGLPVLEALVGSLSGWHDRWVQTPLAFWSACLPALIFFGLRPIGRRAARAGALVAACTPMLYVANFHLRYGELLKAGLRSDYLLGAGADLPLAALLAAAVALILHGRRIGSLPLQALGGLCAAGGAMIKNEGLALLGCLGLALLLGGALWPRGTAGRAARASLLALLVAALAVAPWIQLRAALPAIDENYTEHFTWERISHFLGGGLELVERSPKALVGQAEELVADPPRRMELLPEYFLGEFIDIFSWGLLWFLFMFALPWRKAELLETDRRWLAMLGLGGVLLYFLILLVTPWYLPLLREKGIPERLLVHLMGPLCLLIGWRLGGADRETPAATARSEADPPRG